MPVKIPQLVINDYLIHAKSFFKSISTSKYKNIVLTVSIGALGLSIAVNYFVQKLSNKNKKRILNSPRQLIQSIPELNGPNVRIKNPNYVEQILSNMIRDGKQSLQVISDFDRTISLCSYKGQNCLTSASLLEKSSFISSETRAKLNELREFYLPIEHDPTLTKEEKMPRMIEWWSKSYCLIASSNFTRQDLVEIVKNSTTHLKEGCKWFFYALERNNVPLLIFSAGLGDIIQEWIMQQCGTFSNMRIVANFMSFDNTTNKITGFIGNLIHIFNKNEGALLDTEYEQLIENRQNIILLGDSIGDIHMADGFLNLKNILKIGFLNEHVDEHLTKYMSIYDIVTINDDTFEIPNAIIRNII